jgi:hypothetical protein
VFPLNHKWESAAETAAKSRPLLFGPDTERAFSAHNTATHVVPQTHESLWSGHFLPALESMAEAEVSSNLVLCGYYKQAMASLRSSLELGLLSVYWNVGDDGHLIIKRWLNSGEDTPRPGEIWGRLGQHAGIARFAEATNLNARIHDVFGGLSNFVHARGAKYSNDYWHPELGYLGQPPSHERIQEWIDTYREIVWIVLWAAPISGTSRRVRASGFLTS